MEAGVNTGMHKSESETTPESIRSVRCPRLDI